MNKFQAGMRVTITNKDYPECGDVGVLEFDDEDGECLAVRFDDGSALGVGECDIAAA